MTSASIMEMSKAGFVTSANAAKTVTPSPSVQFSDAMEFASAGQQEESAETVPSSEVKTHAEKSAAQHVGRKEIREAETVESGQEVDSEQVSEEMETAEEEIVKEIAQELGVSEEEVRQAMEVLGLGVMDLQSQGNMAQLAAQLTGMQAVDVLTDESMFAQITELTETVQNELQAVADSLGVDLEQLRSIVEEKMTATQVTEAVQPKSEIVQGEEPAEEAAQVVDEIPEQETEAVDEAVGEMKKPELMVESQEEQKPETVVQMNKPEAETADSDGKEENKNAFLMQNGQGGQVPSGDVNVANQAANAEWFEGQLDLEQTRELIDQIAEYVKVNHTEKVSSMEIQLHPVELGTVNLQVVAKDGAVSARLAVQDEAVRAALESQVMQLRETLQEQGLKIDAVEVTVATHEFEQNLDQHGRDAEENAAKEKKNSRRILDLNEIGQEDLDGEEISDADRLQIEMMRMGGNRLNFRV